MFNIFGFFKKKEECEKIPRFPSSNNIEEWIFQKVSYFERKCPEKMYMLFCPSFGDYLPANIVVGVSVDAMKKNLEFYRNIKKKYPDAVEKARENYCSHSKFIYGDPLDYHD